MLLRDFIKTGLGAAGDAPLSSASPRHDLSRQHATMPRARLFITTLSFPFGWRGLKRGSRLCFPRSNYNRACVLGFLGVFFPAARKRNASDLIDIPARRGRFLIKRRNFCRAFQQIGRVSRRYQMKSEWAIPQRRQR